MKYFTSTYWKGQRLLLLAFLLLHVIVSSVYISWQSITFDEKDYYGYSIKWLHGDVNRNDKIYDSKTPLVAIAAIPRMIKQVSDPGYKATDNGTADILQGRYLMVLFTLITAIYLFKWTRRLFGEKAWIVPLLFFLFDPLVLGFSMIITSDLASGTCLLAIAYHFYRFSIEKTSKHLLLFSAWLGIGVVCKASLLYFVPCGAILILIQWIFSKAPFNLKQTLLHSLSCIIIVLVIINLAYFGEGSFRTLSRSQFQSSSFQSLARTPFVKDIPVPLPYSYVQGLDMLQFHGEIGAGHPESTHHGTFIGNASKEQGGFWYYYLYTGFYKIPITTLLLIIIGVVACFVQFRNEFLNKHIWYLIPFVFFFVILSCFNPFQSGFRHFLLIYPFCFLLIAAAISFMQKKIRLTRSITIAFLGYAFISTALFFPWLISYTNEFITDKKTVFRKLKDSSIDYGQNSSQLQKFIKDNPGLSPLTNMPAPGKYIVSAFHLINYKDRYNASWLTKFEPVSHYQYSMFIFNISEADINSIKKDQR